MTGICELKFSVDSSGLHAAIASLEKLAERAPEVVQLFLDRCDSLSQLVRFDTGDRATAAGELRICLQPSDFFRHFLSTALAGDVDGMRV